MAAFSVAHLYPYVSLTAARHPDPAGLASRWNFDPLLLVTLGAVAIAYPWLMRSVVWPSPGVRRWRTACFYLGWAIGAAALLSPLCALSVSLFSARVGQHMVLETIAAPLVAFGARDRRWRRRAPRHDLAAAVAFAAMLWFWHAPGPYVATFESDWVYWLMHITTFGAAVWLWRTLLDAPAQRVGVFIVAMLTTTLQMGFLGALLTFSAQPLFAVHAFTTAPWGLTPLEDQQLGGVIMWIPAGVIFLVAIIAGAAVAIEGAETRSQIRSIAAARG